MINELEEQAGWRRGERLFNENHGYGAVMEVKESDDGPVVHVCFDNGYKTQFLSEYQSRAYEKIGDDL
jgi:DNA helicase-2/ATP-dependent DNA helicase PcrA